MINPYYIGVIEMGVSGAAVLGFCAWQYWSVRTPAKPKDGLPSDPGHSEGKHHPNDR